MEIIKKRKAEDGGSNRRVREIEWTIRKRKFENGKLKKETKEKITLKEYDEKNKNNDLKKPQEGLNNNEDLEKKFKRLISEQPKTIISKQKEEEKNKEYIDKVKEREKIFNNLEVFLQENKSESRNKIEVEKLKEELQAKIEKVEKKPINVDVFESEVINPVEFLLTNDYGVNLRGVIPYDEAYTQITSHVLCAIFGNLIGLAMISSGFLAPFAPALMIYSSVPTFVLKAGLKNIDSQIGDIFNLSSYKSLTDLLIEYKNNGMRDNINLKMSNEKVRRTFALKEKSEKKIKKLQENLDTLKNEEENIVKILDKIDENTLKYDYLKNIKKIDKQEFIKSIIRNKNAKSLIEKENQNSNGLSLKK